MHSLAPNAGTGERYQAQVGELWSGLAHTLARLETIAAEPEQLADEERFEALRRLQYALHRTSEHAYGLAPPAGTEPVHTELAAALAGARDATGEVVEAVSTAGADAAQPLVYEWRGALFRVRLARMRLAATPLDRAVAQPDPRSEIAAPLAAAVLVVAGVTTFAAGATLALWPVWLAGALGVVVSFLIYKP